MLRNTRRPREKLNALGDQGFKEFLRFKDASKFVPLAPSQQSCFYQGLVWSVCWWKRNMQIKRIWLFAWICLRISKHNLSPCELDTMLPISNRMVLNLEFRMLSGLQGKMATCFLTQTGGPVSVLFYSESSRDLTNKQPRGAKKATRQEAVLFFHPTEPLLHFGGLWKTSDSPWKDFTAQQNSPPTQ